MKYTVWYNNNVERKVVAEFETLKEAKSYFDINTEGYDEVADGDNCYETSSNSFCYEIYDGEPIEIAYDEDGEVDDANIALKDAVYQTKKLYSIAKRRSVKDRNNRGGKL